MANVTKPTGLSIDTHKSNLDVRVAELARAGRAFISVWVTTTNSSGGYLHEDEKRLVDALQAFYDQLLVLTTEGIGYLSKQPIGIRLAIRDMSAPLLILAKTVALEDLLADAQARDSYKARREAEWNEQVARPLYDCALSLALGMEAGRVSADILAFAELGESFGCTGGMGAEEAKAAYQDRFDRWASTPVYGSLPYGRERSELQELVYPLNRCVSTLEDTLGRLRRMSESASNRSNGTDRSESAVDSALIGDEDTNRQAEIGIRGPQDTARYCDIEESYYESRAGEFLRFDYESHTELLEERDWKGMSWKLVLRTQDGTWLSGVADKALPRGENVVSGSTQDQLPRNGFNFKWTEITGKDVFKFCSDEGIRVPASLLREEPAVTEPGQSRGVGSKVAPEDVRSKAKSDKDYRNRMVAEFLSARPQAIARDISTYLGLSEGCVKGTGAWKNHRAKFASTNRSVPEVKTAFDPACLAQSKETDPADALAYAEIVERLENNRSAVEKEYLSIADPDSRRAYRDSDHEDQNQTLALWLLECHRDRE